MRYCKNCLFPDTKPDLYFDKEGICDARRSAETKWNAEKMLDWEERGKEFDNISEDFTKK